MQYKDIYKKELNGAYLFYGYEKLLIENAVEYVINKYISKDLMDFNLTLFQSKNLTVEALMSSCETLPMMAEKRVIIVKDIQNIEFDKDVFKFIDNLADFIILIFVDSDDSLVKTKSFYKYFYKNKRNVEFSKLDNKEIVRFVQGYVARKGGQISPVDLNFLVSRIGYDSRNIDKTLYDVKNELDKLISLCKGESITKDIIEKATMESADSNIFNFLDAISTKNTQRALKEFNKLHQMNEPNQKILFMIIRQTRLLISYIDLRDGGYSNSEIQSSMNVKNFEFSKIAQFAKNFNKSKLYEIYKELLEVDEMLKTSRVVEDVIMEMLIVKYCQ